MNILVLAVGSYGDVLPLAGLAREMRSRGYTVTFFTNDYFRDFIQNLGLTFIPLGSSEDYDRFANNPALWHPHKGWRLLMKGGASPRLREAYHMLCNHLKHGRALLMSSTLGIAARLVQETHHIPLATVHFSPGVFHSAYSPPRMPHLVLPDWLPIRAKQVFWTCLDHLMIDPLLKPYLNEFRRELGLPPVSRIFHSWIHSPDLVLGMFPDWFSLPQVDWPPGTVLTGFPLFDESHDSAMPETVQAFLDAYPQPLVFTPGSANKHGRRFFLEALAACREMDRPGIFLTRYPEQLPASLPNSVRHFSYVPLSRLLPHCTALIHHGGIGTCSQALRAGIPQLIQPLAFDQFDNGARAIKLGVGAVIPKRLFRAGHIVKKLNALISSAEVQTNCLTISERMKKFNNLALTCDVLEHRFLKKVFMKSGE